MTPALLAELSEVFRRDAEHLDGGGDRPSWQARVEPDEDAMREVDRLHRIADDLWERSLLT